MIVIIMAGLIKLISSVIREDREASHRPIFLIGKGFGALLALLIAAHPPQRDNNLSLIVVDPGRHAYMYICVYAKISAFDPSHLYRILVVSPSSITT